MAGIGRAPKGEKPDSVDNLEKDYAESIAKIRALLGGRKDKNDIRDEERQKLRAEYSRAAQLARTLSQRVTDDEKRKKYEEQYKQLTAVAASYGSVITSRVPDTTFDDVKGLENVKKLVMSKRKINFHASGNGYMP